jgi:acetyl esterase/lipase
MRPLSSAMLGLALSLALFPPALAQSSLEQSMGEANAQPGPRSVPGRVIAVPDDVSPGLAADITKPYRTPAWNANPPDDAAWLALIDKLAASAAAAQSELREKLGVKMTPAEMAGVPVFILEPKEMPAENSNRVLLNLHGGGYVHGPGETGTGEAAVMTGYEHFRVIEVDYRMPPTHPYPAAMDDAMAVYKALLATTDPKHIAVFGTSTGGGMTLALMTPCSARSNRWGAPPSRRLYWRRCRALPSRSRASRRSRRRSRARLSPWNSAPTARNGARTNCCVRSLKPPSAPAGAFTCTCWRPAISAPSRTPPIPRASSRASNCSACSRRG